MRLVNNFSIVCTVERHVRQCLHNSVKAVGKFSHQYYVFAYHFLYFLSLTMIRTFSGKQNDAKQGTERRFSQVFFHTLLLVNLLVNVSILIYRIL